MAIAVTPGRNDDDRGEKGLTVFGALATGIILGVLIYAMLDAYVL